MKDEELQNALSMAAAEWQAAKNNLDMLGIMGMVCVGLALVFGIGGPGATVGGGAPKEFDVGLAVTGLISMVIRRARSASWRPAELILAQLLSDEEDPGLLPILIPNLNQGSPNTKKLVRATVTRLLNQDAVTGGSTPLAEACMQMLLRDIARFRHTDLGPQFEEGFLVAVLETFKARLYVPALADLRWMPVDYYTRLNPRIAAALADCMTALSSEAQRQAKAGVLLRPADAPANQREHLLTPARAAAEADEQQLLRGSAAE